MRISVDPRGRAPTPQHFAPNDRDAYLRAAWLRAAAVGLCTRHARVDTGDGACYNLAIW